MALTAVQVGAGWFSENPGGLDRYYHDLLETLTEHGVACRGLVVGTHSVEEETDSMVRAFAAPDEPILRRWRNVRQAVTRAWQALPPDGQRVLVSHFAIYAYPLLKDANGKPWVVHFHGPWAAESKREGGNSVVAWMKKRLETSVYRRADRIIVLSEAFGELLCQAYGVEASRVRVIPGGVDIGRFADIASISKQAAREQFGWPVDRPIVLSVRRLTSRMGLETLVDAVAAVKQRVPNALCLIAGRGPLAESLVQRIDAAGLNDSVTLLGFVPDDDLPLAYRAADLTIMPSQTLEGFGLSAAESLAAGTPVLVTPIGGLPEVVSGLDVNLITHDATAPAMAEAMVRALNNPDLLPSAQACRDYAARMFDWDLIADRVAAVYAEAAAAK